MPKQKTDDLIQLIRSLTRAEKRHFRLFVRRNQSSDEILFLQLFDVMDRHKEYDEGLILRKFPGCIFEGCEARGAGPAFYMVVTFCMRLS